MPGVDCGTACCVAGYASIVLGGYTPTTPGRGSVPEVLSPEGVFLHYEDAADRVLGVDMVTWRKGDNYLYSGSNDKATVLRILDDMIAEGEREQA